MAIPTYQFLNEAGVQKLAEQLLNKVNIRIGERIVTEFNENSSDKQVASAKALYNAISAIQSTSAGLAGRLDGHDTKLTEHGEALAALATSQGEQDTKITGLETNLQTLTDTVNSLTHLTIETVEGEISTVTDPRTDVLYLQRDNAEDKTWMMYIYRAPAAEGEAGSWINVGDTEVDLSNYWSKDSIEEMKVALGMHDVEPIPEANILSVIDTAFANTVVDLGTTPDPEEPELNPDDGDEANGGGSGAGNSGNPV